MQPTTEYKHLKPKRGSRYKQLFFGRIWAEVLYRETVGNEPLSPQEVAREYNVPLEAVLEANDYCTKNKELLDAERAREEASIKAARRDKWPYAPKPPPASNEPLHRRRHRQSCPGHSAQERRTPGRRASSSTKSQPHPLA